MQKIAVLGGGVAGLVAARTLSNYQTFDIELLERNDRLGGLHQSLELNGVVFDIGAFEFTPYHGLMQAFPEIVDDYVRTRQKNVVVTPNGSLDTYPFSMAGYIHNYGRVAFGLGIASLLADKCRYRHPQTLDGWVKYHIGSQFYRQTGLQAYIERLYGSTTAEVDMEFARKRLGSLAALSSFDYVVERYLRPALQPKQKPVADAAPAPAPLGNTLVRPPGGFSQVYDGVIHPLLRSAGVTITTSTQLKSIQKDGQGFRLDTDRGIKTYDRVISTLPLSTTARLCGMAVDQSHIKFQSLVSLFYTFRGSIHTDATILYNFTLTGQWKRIVFLSKYYGRHQGQDYFTVEVPGCDLLTPETISTAFEQHMASLNLLCGTFQLQGHTTTREAYPLYQASTMANLRQVRADLATCGIDLVGRQGQFDHISSSDAAWSAHHLATSLGQAG